ncbi:MAG: quinone-dependent dihydroorotate dehydrogenase [Coraliomargaritaceae bacterium]
MGVVYENLVRPLLFRMEPEQAHDMGAKVLRAMPKAPGLCPLLRAYSQFCEDRPVKLFGLEFPNRVGLAAGMDKNAEFCRAVEALGFGHAEVGTVTPQGQPGNPQPRLFRYPESESIVNRMGFNNYGAESMAQRLSIEYPKGKRRMPVGINIGKAKETPLEEAANDYLSCFRALADQADYFTVNISSPNTAGLRDLQSKAYLSELLSALRDENCSFAKRMGREPHPMLLKIAPDLHFKEIDTVLETLLDVEFSGVIATNTTIARPERFPGNEAGGLSGGSFLGRRSREVVKYIHLATQGKLPIIGVGGIDSPETAGAMVDAGASLVQIYTAWIYKGPFLVRSLARSLKSRGEDWI